MKLSHKIAITGITLGSLFGISNQAQACSGFEPMLGSMCMFGGNFAPRGYALAQGQLLSINQNQALFSLFGTTYGGDGRTSFGLPDMRGRAAIGTGAGPGLSNIRLGQRGGNELTVLTIANLPAHTHSVSVSVDSAADYSASSITLRALAGRSNSNDPTGAVLGNSPNRENIYSSSGVPTVDMNAQSISANISSEITNTVNVSQGSVGNNVAFSNRSPYLGMNFIIALQGTFPSRS